MKDSCPESHFIARFSGHGNEPRFFTLVPRRSRVCSVVMLQSGAPFSTHWLPHNDNSTSWFISASGVMSSARHDSRAFTILMSLRQRSWRSSEIGAMEVQAAPSIVSSRSSCRPRRNARWSMAGPCTLSCTRRVHSCAIVGTRRNRSHSERGDHSNSGPYNAVALFLSLGYWEART